MTFSSPVPEWGSNTIVSICARGNNYDSQGIIVLASDYLWTAQGIDAKASMTMGFDVGSATANNTNMVRLTAYGNDWKSTKPRLLWKRCSILSVKN